MTSRLSTFYSLFLTLMLISCQQKISSDADQNIFRFNILSGLTSLDPAYASNKPKWWLTNQIFDGLVKVDSKLNIQPCIAKSWTKSEDGKCYTFHLQKDIYFHKSEVFKSNATRELVAEDVVYSLKRVLTEGTGAWVFNDKLLRNNGLISDTAFSAVNDSTVKIYLNQPCFFFEYILTMPYCFIIPKEAVEAYGESFRSHPIGTGPFQYKFWYEDSKLILEKNESYWKETNSNVDLVVVSFIADANQEFRLFINNRLDFIYSLEDGARDELFNLDGKLKPNFSKTLSVQKNIYLNTEYLGFQLDEEAPCYRESNGVHPFLDHNIRKALNLAIDKHVLVSYFKSGLGVPGNEGFIPKGMRGLKSRVDIKKRGDALGYFKKSTFYGKIDNYKLQLQVQAVNKPIAEFLQKQWEEVLGIFVEIDVCDGSTLRNLANNGKSKFFYGNWIADYPDPENFTALFFSPNFKPKGPNKMHYKDKRIDSLFIQASTETNEQKRLSLHAIIDSIAMESQPVIPLYYDQSVWLYHHKIVGLENNPVGLLDLENISILASSQIELPSK